MAEGASQIDEMDAIEPFDVFISYAHKDETQFGYAAELAKALDDASITYWYDKSLNNEGGANWNTSITKRMEKATIILALWTPLYLSRPMCRFESTYATGAEKLLPVALEEIRQEHFTEELAGLAYALQPRGVGCGVACRAGQSMDRARCGRKETARAAPKACTGLRGDRAACERQGQLARRAHLRVWIPRRARHGREPAAGCVGLLRTGGGRRRQDPHPRAACDWRGRQDGADAAPGRPAGGK